MHAVIVIGGDPPDPRVVERLPHERFVIAADSGLDHALTLGLTVDLVVGDLDSVSALGLSEAERLGIPIERFPRDKDFTDTELALTAALSRHADAVTIVTGGGDRLDHALAALLIVTHPALGRTPAMAWVGEAHVTGLRGPAMATLHGPAGDLVSLLAVGGVADAVTTTGLRFPLTAERLDPASSRGVSNELVGGPATVAVERGALLLIRPYALRGTP